MTTRVRLRWPPHLAFLQSWGRAADGQWWAGLVWLDVIHGLPFGLSIQPVLQTGWAPGTVVEPVPGESYRVVARFPLPDREEWPTPDPVWAGARWTGLIWDYGRLTGSKLPLPFDASGTPWR